MIPTPDLSHLTSDDYAHVYEPAEDTVILLDALEKDADEIKSSRPSVCLEIGSGSGVVSAFVGSIVGPSNTLYLSTYINPRACHRTLLTGKQISIPLSPIIGPLVAPLLPRLSKQIDILVFNPPYVPTSSEEVIQAQTQEMAGINGAWAGGESGMEVTDDLLEIIGDILSPKGRFYLVALKQNNCTEDESEAWLALSYELSHPLKRKGNLKESLKVVLERRAGREYLLVLRFARPSGEV